MKYFYRINNEYDALHRHINRTGDIEVSLHFKDIGQRKGSVAVRCLPEEYKGTAKSVYEINTKEKVEKIEKKIKEKQ